MFIIPFKNFSSFTEEITLTGIPYIFKFDWVSRNGFWLLSIYNREEVPLLEGKRLVINYEHIEQFVDIGLPSGKLCVIDVSTNDYSPILQDDFINERALLIYAEESEIESL